MSVDNTFARNEPLWRDRNRGLSFQNSKDCDAIFIQFFHITLDRTVIQHETTNELMEAIDVSINMEPEQ